MGREIKHGMSKTRTYGIWANMKNRCKQTRERENKSYKLKGVSVCSRWQNFETFLNDMGECPEGKSIDRIDNSLGYDPLNCRWVSPKEQMWNKDRKSIYWHKKGGKYVARIKYSGQNIHLGSFYHYADAEAAYKKFKHKYHCVDSCPEYAKRIHKCWDNFYSKQDYKEGLD